MTNDFKPCVACADDIKGSAKLCKHCGVMQNDDRFATAATETSVADSQDNDEDGHRCGRCGARLQIEPGECSSCGVSLPYVPNRAATQASTPAPALTSAPVSAKDKAFESYLSRRNGAGPSTPQRPEYFGSPASPSKPSKTGVFVALAILLGIIVVVATLNHPSQSPVSAGVDGGYTSSDLLSRLNSQGSSSWSEDTIFAVNAPIGFITDYLADGNCTAWVFDNRDDGVKFMNSGFLDTYKFSYNMDGHDDTTSGNYVILMYHDASETCAQEAAWTMGWFGP